MAAGLTQIWFKPQSDMASAVFFAPLRLCVELSWLHGLKFFRARARARTRGTRI